MVSLKMTQAEAKAEGYTATPSVPEYPWGTSLTLVDEVAKALFPEMPQVGGSVSLDAMATVSYVNIVQQQDGKSRVSIELQLTDLEIEEPEEDKPSPAQVMYGTKG